MTQPTGSQSTHSRRRSGGIRVIEGEAVVVARRAGAPGGLPDAPTPPESQATPCGRKRTVLPMRRPAPAPDLVFQTRAFAGPGLSGGGSGGRAVFRAAPGRGGIAGAALLALAVLLPAAILLSRDEPVAITSVVEAKDGFVLAELGAAIRPRRGGEVLEVEGLIRNASNADAPVPRLQIALAGDDGTIRIRPLATGMGRLAAGSALRFHSAVAVAVGTTGDLSVGFVADATDAANPRKTAAR